MLKIRLQRTGRKHEPTFRVVLTDSKNSTKSRKFLEILGSFDPRRKDEASFKSEKIQYWISKGAKPSDTMHNLLIEKGIIKGEKINVLPRKTPIKNKEESGSVEATPNKSDSAEATPNKSDSAEVTLDKEEKPAEVPKQTPVVEEAEEVPKQTPVVEEAEETIETESVAVVQEESPILEVKEEMEEKEETNIEDNIGNELVANLNKNVLEEESPVEEKKEEVV